MPYNLKSGRWGFRQRRSAEIGVPTNLEMENENSIFNQLLKQLTFIEYDNK